MTKVSLSILYLLNILANMIEFTYDAGIFYRKNLHPYTLKAIAFAITLSIVSYNKAMELWDDREFIMLWMNVWRNKIGDQLVLNPKYAY